MAMPFFMERTELYDLKGRQNYISSDEEQSEIVIQSPAVNFTDDIENSHKNNKQDKTWSQKQKKMVDSKTIEGLEIIHSLPNSWYYDFKNGNMSEAELRKKINGLTFKTLETERTKATGRYPKYQYAAHFNKKGDAKKDNNGKLTGEYYEVDNFNLHIIFTERTEDNVGTYSRNIYMAVEGGATSVKSKAHILPNGEPYILHYKGESKGKFSSKDPEYTSINRYQKKREEIKDYWRKDLGIELGRDYVYFHQYKHGKGRGKDSDASKIKLKNKRLLEADILVEEFQGVGYTFPPKGIQYDDEWQTNPAFKAFLNDVTDDDENKDMRQIVEKYGIPPAPAAAFAADIKKAKPEESISTVSEKPEKCIYNFEDDGFSFADIAKRMKEQEALKSKPITNETEPAAAVSTITPASEAKTDSDNQEHKRQKFYDVVAAFSRADEHYNRIKKMEEETESIKNSTPAVGKVTVLEKGYPVTHTITEEPILITSETNIIKKNLNYNMLAEKARVAVAENIATKKLKSDINPKDAFDIAVNKRSKSVSTEEKNQLEK